MVTVYPVGEHVPATLGVVAECLARDTVQFIHIHVQQSTHLLPLGRHLIDNPELHFLPFSVLIMKESQVAEGWLLHYNTVKPLIKDSLKEDKPSNKGQAESTLVIVYTLYRSLRTKWLVPKVRMHVLN